MQEMGSGKYSECCFLPRSEKEWMAFDMQPTRIDLSMRTKPQGIDSSSMTMPEGPLSLIECTLPSRHAQTMRYSMSLTPLTCMYTGAAGSWNAFWTEVPLGSSMSTCLEGERRRWGGGGDAVEVAVRWRWRQGGGGGEDEEATAGLAVIQEGAEPVEDDEGDGGQEDHDASLPASPLREARMHRFVLDRDDDEQ